MTPREQLRWFADGFRLGVTAFLLGFVGSVILAIVGAA